MKATALHSHVSAFLFLTFLGLPACAATWYVSGDGRGGDGSRSDPFSSLPAAEKASAAGDTIVLIRAAAPYEQGIVLKEGQTLTADETSSPILRVTKGAAVAVHDAGNIAIRGITIELVEGGEGIVLTNARGTVTVQGGSVSGSGTGTAVLIDGGDAAIAFEAFPIAQSSASAVVIRRHHGPSVFFRNGSSVDVTAGTLDAISLTDNAGSYAFSDPVRIATRGARAFVATDSGTVSIAGASTLATDGATGVHIARTSVSIQLQSLTVNGLIGGKGVPANDGVVLDQVSGTFAVAAGAMHSLARRGISIVKSKGVAISGMQFVNVPTANTATAQICGSPAATGEHLQCAAAIHLQESEDVTLEDLRITDSAQLAINSDTVRNLSLTKVEIRGAGDELNEHGLQLRNVSGELKIHGSRIEGSTSRQMYLLEESGEAAIDIRDSSFGGSKPPEGGQGVLIDARGDARLRIAVNGSSFTGNFSNGVQLAATGNADVHIDVLGSTFQKNAAAVSLSSAGASTLVYRIEGNKVGGSTSTALNVHSSASKAAQGQIARNVIGVSGKSGSGAVCGGGCNGISVTSIGGGASSAVIAGNTVQQVDGGGIQVRTGGNGTLAVRIAGNIIREPSGADTLHAISVMAGMKRNDSAAVCAEVGGVGDQANTISGAWNAAGGGTSISLMKLYERARLSIADYAGDATNADGLSRFVAGRNHGGAVEANPGTGVTLTDRCSIP
jgi:hypothetical protein